MICFGELQSIRDRERAVDRIAFPLQAALKNIIEFLLIFDNQDAHGAVPFGGALWSIGPMTLSPAPRAKKIRSHRAVPANGWAIVVVNLNDPGHRGAVAGMVGSSPDAAGNVLSDPDPHPRTICLHGPPRSAALLNSQGP